VPDPIIIVRVAL